MKKTKRIFSVFNRQRGGMLVELMLSIALAAIIIPFVFRYQEQAVSRAKNIAVTKQMESVQNSLERYIVENKTELMKPLGKKIFRVKVADLVNYGLPEYIADNYKDDYQLRILKSADRENKSTLQGIIILNNDEISPLRTREIVNLGGGKFGFVDNGVTYGGFGAFHANAVDFGITDGKGLIGTTSVKRGNNDYLWRVPSENKEDSTMLSPLNLDGHDINNVKFLDSYKAQFDEKLNANKIVTSYLAFNNRSTLESVFLTNSAVVNGTLTSDAKNMNVAGLVSLVDSAKFSSFHTKDLYVNTLTLNGFSVKSDSGKSPILKVVGDMDLIMGRVNAGYVSVGYTGSVTPRLSITDKIQDSKDSNYYWDIKSKKARFADLMSPELSRLAMFISEYESKKGTESAFVFDRVSANANATVGDYINSLNEIEKRVRVKYQMLNLE